MFINVTPAVGQSHPRHLEPTQPQQSEETVAVLFLVDESGGVNGKCDVSKDLVFVVDNQEAQRYQIVHFFLTLMGSLYDEEYGLPDKTSLPNLQIGVAQFAEDYQVVYEFVSATQVFQTQLPPEGPVDDIGVCYTDYVHALDSARKDLESTNADHRILILITDGSFRGSEQSWSAVQQKHEEIRGTVESKLKELHEKQISVYSFVLGINECVEQNDCGLRSIAGNDEYGMRKGDLRTWAAWDNREWNRHYLSLLDEKTVASAFASVDLLPHKTVGNFVKGLGTYVPSDTSTQVTFSGWVEQQYVNIIAVKPLPDYNYLHLTCPSLDNPDGATVNTQIQNHIPFAPHPGFFDNGNYWWRYELTPIQLPPETECCIQTWNLKVNDSDSYVWRQPRERGMATSLLITRTASLVQMNDNAAGKTLPVTAYIQSENLQQLKDNACYKVQFEFNVESENTPRYSEFLNIGGQSVSGEIDLSGISCPSRKGLLSAQVMGQTSQSGVGLQPIIRSEQIEVSLKYEPEILTHTVTLPDDPRFGCASSENSESYRITIPIRYATEDCNPGFEPQFELSFESNPNEEKTQIAGCPNSSVPQVLKLETSDENGRYITRKTEQGDRVDYVIELLEPKNDNLPAYWECGYTTLLVKINDQTVKSIPYFDDHRESIDVSVFLLLALSASIGVNSLRALSLPQKGTHHD
jgi:hypothetical protein